MNATKKKLSPDAAWAARQADALGIIFGELAYAIRADPIAAAQLRILYHGIRKMVPNVEVLARAAKLDVGHNPFPAKRPARVLKFVRN